MTHLKQRFNHISQGRIENDTTLHNYNNNTQNRIVTCETHEDATGEKKEHSKTAVAPRIPEVPKKSTIRDSATEKKNIEMVLSCARGLIAQLVRAYG